MSAASASNPPAAPHHRRAARTIVDISVIALGLDLVYGMVTPTFSLYVTDLGGTSIVVGALAATVAATELLGALPVGSLTDHIGRKTTIVAGSMLFALSCLAVTVPAEPWLLAIPRVGFGIGLLATFPIGIAYLADSISRAGRPIAIGIYVSAQGLGFTLGPLLGGFVADRYGKRDVFYVGAAAAALTACFAWKRLGSGNTRPAGSRRFRIPVAEMVRGPILGVNLSNLVVLVMANGAVMPFLSLFAARLGMGTLGIGALYAVRSAVSSIVRVPAGFFIRSISGAYFLLFALCTDAVAATGLGFAHSVAVLFAGAVVDGTAFGVFMTASQSMITEQAPPGLQGAMIGGFAAVGALGEMIGALTFGALAHAVSIRTVFLASAVVLVASLPVIWRSIDPRRASLLPQSQTPLQQ